jgi:pyruvate/2-oxoglutarate dehydrogenase complex dihydrolipoamide acyltransferase (E2) component
MRFLAILAVSAAFLAPALASADPVQPQAAPADQAQPATPPAPAQQTAQAAPAAAPAASDADLDKIECRMGTPPTGSRLGATRTCHTEREWAQIQKDSQDMLKTTQMNGHQFGLANPVSGTK